MLEVLTQRYIRTTPDGHLDPIVTLQNLFGAPRSSHELSAEVYLGSLSASDRSHVEHFLSFTRTLRFTPTGPHLAAVIAVGSTTRPEAGRHHPAEDIDLRILNSAPSKGTNLREHMVDYIEDSVRGYLQSSGIDFQEFAYTSLRQMGWAKEPGLKVLRPYFYVDTSTEPSFLANYPDGLPLHLSVSGVEGWPTMDYLKAEREHNQYFALLYEGDNI